MSENNKGGRLPPPAFPPGMRKRSRRAARTAEEVPPEEAGADAAFISPDEPMPDRDQSVSEALISPDDPMPVREEARGADDAAADEGVVTGMGLDPRVEARDLMSGVDPHLGALIESVARFAEALKRKGEAGLRTTSDMTRFEATMRSYCVGYLRGRRVEEEPPPVAPSDHLPSDY